MTDDDAPDGGETGGEQDGEQSGEQSGAQNGEPAGLSGERSPTELGPGSTASPPPGDDAASGDDADQQEASGDAPLSDLREDVAERRARADEDDFEELFTEIEVGNVDEESVWEALSESDDDPLVDAEFVEEDADGDREVTVVEKSMCHGCPHFADPPETACTHDGTTIDAEVDTDHFRVVDCPIVEERREREMETTDFSAEDA